MATLELMELREQSQERKTRLISFWHDISNYSRLINSGEDGTRRPLEAFRLALQQLNTRIREFSDNNDNLSAIIDAINDLKLRLSALLALDTGLSWNAGLLSRSLDSFAHLLSQKLPIAPSKPTEDVTPDPHRWQLLNAIDELAARLMTLGDFSHGGLESRRPVVAETMALRRQVQSDLYSPINAPQVTKALEAIKVSVHALASVPSVLTGQAGFMARAFPGIDAQLDAMVLMINKLVVPARIKGSLSIRP